MQLFIEPFHNKKLMLYKLKIIYFFWARPGCVLLSLGMQTPRHIEEHAQDTQPPVSTSLELERSPPVPPVDPYARMVLGNGVDEVEGAV